MDSRNPTVIVVVAHPDDEALGAGGTIAKLSDSGADVHCVSMTDGATGRSCDNVEKQMRATQFQEACNILGCKSCVVLEFSDQKLDSIPVIDITRRLEEVTSDFKANIVITHSCKDLNQDHLITYKVAKTIFRPFKCPDLILFACFEVPSSTEIGSMGCPTFCPNLFIDISDYYDKKLDAISRYESEAQPAPLPRSEQSINALTQYRGYACRAHHAEAFEIQYQKVITLNDQSF